MVKKLDREQALRQATLLFWRSGYDGTSMDMVTKALGVEKPSIYAAFGNKHALFIEAMRHYRTHLVDHVRESLASAPTAREGIDAMVKFMMTSRYRPGTQDGCLVSNAALELADRDEEVAQHVAAMLSDLAALFEAALLKAQAQGDVTSKVPAKLLAAFLINAIEGTRIVEKTDPGEDAATSLAEFVLRQLD